MTGFARAESENGKQKCTVEIRSVNHRFLDINVRIPSKNFDLIKQIKDIVSGKISRGSIEITVSLSANGENPKKIVVDDEIVKQYLEGSKSITANFPIYGELELNTLMTMKDIFKYEEDEDIGDQGKLIQKTVDEALEKLIEMRSAEGSALQKDVLERLDGVEVSAEKISEIRREQADNIAGKLKTKLEEVFANFKIDDQRVLAEAAIFADRSDISEEITRLESHIVQVRELISNGGNAGRKLEFILQEMNREANTIGSKCSIYNISQEVVEIKSNLEKIREQAANIE
jgi:uncharacterized protein (TIGR00255 family)